MRPRLTSQQRTQVWTKASIIKSGAARLRAHIKKLERSPGLPPVPFQVAVHALGCQNERLRRNILLYGTEIATYLGTHMPAYQITFYTAPQQSRRRTWRGRQSAAHWEVTPRHFHQRRIPE